MDAGRAVSSVVQARAIVLDDSDEGVTAKRTESPAFNPLYSLQDLPSTLVDSLRRWLDRCSGLRADEGTSRSQDGSEAWVILPTSSGIPDTRHPSPNATPLSIALHRLRMFKDPQLWTGAANPGLSSDMTKVRGFYAAGENACMDTTLAKW